VCIVLCSGAVKAGKHRSRALILEAFDTGPVSDRAFALLGTGMRAREATAQVHREFGGKTAGCNPAHRSPPLCILAAIADESSPPVR
jgi:hypothetical protein